MMVIIRAADLYFKKNIVYPFQGVYISWKYYHEFELLVSSTFYYISPTFHIEISNLFPGYPNKASQIQKLTTGMKSQTRL